MIDLPALFEKFGEALQNVLPLSPFTSFLDRFKDLPFLGYLNWFIPVGDILKVLIAWLSAIALFYVYSVVLRWIKAIS